jgi:hypothetical protein
MHRRCQFCVLCLFMLVWLGTPGHAEGPSHIANHHHLQQVQPDTSGDLTCAIGEHCEFELTGLVRGWYLNDQRIRWSGLEASFGAEAVLAPRLSHRSDNWHFFTEGQLFINQRYGSTILSDPERDRYRPNFEVDTLKIFELCVGIEYDDVLVRLGRVETPFGSQVSSFFSNARLDAPFIRTEIIGFTETGLFVCWRPDWLRVDAGLVNGESDRDTNSSKGGVGRVGIEADGLAVGVSLKVQDGVGSEHMKRWNSIGGVDVSYWLTETLCVYAEGVWDRHGLRNEPSSLVDPRHFGKRSLYGRDVFAGGRGPEGKGFQFGVLVEHDCAMVDVNWGSYWPETIGLATHDEETHRLLAKGVVHVTSNVDFFAVGLVENRRPREGVLYIYRPWAVMMGSQFVF